MQRKSFIQQLVTLPVLITATFKSSLFSIFEPSPCETTPDGIGLFYTNEVEFRTDLTHRKLKGDLLQVKGQVLATDCETPIDGALIEVWHANPDGDYIKDKVAENCRGKFHSGKGGTYSFKCVKPGIWTHETIGTRPRHIHYKITHPDYRELVTQLYFKGEPSNSLEKIEEDPVTIDRALPLVKTEGGYEIAFDLFLESKYGK